jgi:tetratricopeptide (TPR) repeat protein
MQMYRINYRLLIGLFVGSIVLSIVLYFTWKWQVNRKANWYRERSQLALENDDQLEAFDYLKKFVKLRREDEEALVELADIAAELAVMEGISREDRGSALGVLSDTVRRTGDPGLRRKLADWQFLYGRPQDAITQIKELLIESDDPELQSLYVRALFRARDYNNAIDEAFKSIGYNTLTKEFDGEIAVADQPELYSTLASALVTQRKDIDLARRVIDQMATLNPDSAIAHLEKSKFLHGREEKEEAATELDRAFQLDPESTDVLYRKAEVDFIEKNYEDARRIANEGIELFPDEMRYYHLLARNELFSKQYDEAIAVLNRAIKNFGEKRSFQFMLLKIDVLLSKEDLDGAGDIVRDLEKLNLSGMQPMVDYQRARIMILQGKFAQAVLELEKVRPQLALFGRTQAIAGLLLGEAYEKLGKPDLARRVFEIVADSKALPAGDSLRSTILAKIQRINLRLGLGREVEDSSFNSMIQQILDRPEENQNWQEIDAYIEELVEKRDLTEVQHKLLRAEVFLKREMLKEAKDMIREAARLDPEDVNVRFAAVRLLLKDLPDGPPTALKQLKKIEETFGDSFTSRSLMVEALTAIGGEDLQEQLHELTAGTEDWTNTDQMRLLATIGLKFLHLNEVEEGVLYLSKAAEIEPSNLPIRIQLFDIAFQQHDDEAMRTAQEKILELVGSKKDGIYVLSEVKRRLVGYKGDEESRIGLLEAQRMLDEALKKRPEWHELHILYGQLLVVLGEDADLAMKHLDQALKYGRPDAKAVALLVKLLTQRGDVRQAQEKMELIPAASRGLLLGRVEAAILLFSGELEPAFESAQAEVGRNPNNASTQAWFAEISERTNNLDVAATAYRRASELNPSDHNSWMKLAGLHARRQDLIELENSMRDAALALDPEYLPLLQVKSFELRNSFSSAEGIYINLFKDRLDDPATLQRLANFYLVWSQRDENDENVVPKAATYLNRILRSAYEGELKNDDPIVLWARENASRLLGATGDYQDSLKAQRLLEQGSVDGNVPKNSLPLYGEILSSRRDPVSLLSAIDILSAQNQKGQLNKAQLLLLANLYARTNNWKKGKPLMVDALSRYGADPDVWSTYITLLIGRGEYKTASQRLKRFAEIAGDSTQVFQLRTRLAYERGEQVEVRRLLQSMLPPNLGPSTPLDEQQLNILRAIGGMAVQYEEYEFAEQLFRLYVSRKPEGAFDLVTVTALYGDAEQAMTAMKQLVKENPEACARLAIQMVRQRRTEFGNQFDDAVSELVLSVWKESPDASGRMSLRAEMYEVMEKYDEAIQAYEEIIGRDDMLPVVHAAASNNLAYILALRNQKLDIANQRIDEAIEILGPLADLLDTRAVIQMARNEFDQAVEDMTLSLSIDPTAVKYYHMARAQALAGDEEKAIEAWGKANEMEISVESLPLIERPGFQETKKQIESLSP